MPFFQEHEELETNHYFDYMSSLKGLRIYNMQQQKQKMTGISDEGDGEKEQRGCWVCENLMGASWISPRTANVDRKYTYSVD